MKNHSSSHTIHNTIILSKLFTQLGIYIIFITYCFSCSAFIIAIITLSICVTKVQVTDIIKYMLIYTLIYFSFLGTSRFIKWCQWWDFGNKFGNKSKDFIWILLKSFYMWFCTSIFKNCEFTKEFMYHDLWQNFSFHWFTILLYITYHFL